MIAKSFSPSTIQRYLWVWKQFSIFREAYGLGSTLPVPERHIGLFLVNVFSKEAKAASTITSYLTAIAWNHKIRGFPDPSKSYMLKRLLAGMKSGAKPTKQAKPLTWDILRKVLKALPLVLSQDSYRLRLFKAAYLVAYFASLRIGEFARSGSLKHTLTVENVEFTAGKTPELVLTLPTFKHSKLPARLVIPRGPRHMCAVRAVKKFLKIRPCKKGPLFVYQNGRPIDRVAVASTLKQALFFCGVNSKGYSTHSFRAGRTTDLVESGVSEAIIRESGRWSSDAFRDYIRFDLFKLPGGKSGGAV